MTPTKLHSTDF